jgi:hypothetical protein
MKGTGMMPPQLLGSAVPVLVVALLMQAPGALSRKPFPKHLEHISYWRNKLFNPEQSETFKLIYPGERWLRHRVDVF